jgi:hypothetical protein
VVRVKNLKLEVKTSHTLGGTGEWDTIPKEREVKL